MSTSYADIKQQIAELELKAKEARKVEVAGALASIRDLMKTYDITLADIGDLNKKPKAERKPVADKYRDEATGQTWTGRGRAPKWLEGKNKDDFLIRPAA